MKTKLFTVHDAKAESYTNPFCIHTRGEAIRGFIDVCNDKNTNINKYPEDFTLFEIGEYNLQNASIELHKSPIPLGKAIEFKKTAIMPITNSQGV